MQAGDIVFIRGKGILSKLVRLFDRGRFSHVAIAVSDTHILEANWWTKVHITPLRYTDIEVVPLTLTPLQRDLTVHNAVQLTGKWYDMWKILGILLNRRKRYDDPNALICSEAVTNVLVSIGYLDNGDFTPNELYTFLKEYDPALKNNCN